MSKGNAITLAIVVVLWAVVALGVVAFNAGAHAKHSGAHKYHAVVWCEGMAEDSAGHLRLIDYGHRPDGTLRLVYRCERNGY